MENELIEGEAYGLTDLENPDSIINRIPTNSEILKGAINYLVNTNKYKDAVLEKDWRELFGHSKHYKTMRYLRYSFWNEYRQACELNRVIQVPRIHSGVCTPYMFNRLLKEEMFACYLLTQPQDLKFVQEDLINMGYEQLYEILTMDNLDDKGQPNVKLIQQKQKIIEGLEARRFGSVVHRSQVYQKSETTHTTKPIEDQSKEELEKQLAELQAKLGSDSVEADYVVVDESR
ncbi:MAG: hypothetical protein N4A33_04780 [Bacteriovoracaceae bacterium]|jgi:hypothetical protein|nr:hypothetical protein [Bacteriovoracaceae bacterium]